MDWPIKTMVYCYAKLFIQIYIIFNFEVCLKIIVDIVNFILKIINIRQ